MHFRTLGSQLQSLLDTAATTGAEPADAAHYDTTSFSYALYDMQDRLVHQIRTECKPQGPVVVLETDRLFAPLSHLHFDSDSYPLEKPRSHSPYYPAWRNFTKWLEAEELEVFVTPELLPRKSLGGRPRHLLLLTFAPKPQASAFPAQPASVD
jgi:hypothetical protein